MIQRLSPIDIYVRTSKLAVRRMNSIRASPKQEVVVYENAECEEGEESTRSAVKNATEGIDDGCSRCFCKHGKWRCEIMRCG